MPRVGTTRTEVPPAVMLAMLVGPETRLSLALSASETAIGAADVIVPPSVAVPVIASRLLPLPKAMAPLIVPPLSASVVAPLPRTMLPVMVPLLARVTAAVDVARSMARATAPAPGATAVMVPLLVIDCRVPLLSMIAVAFLPSPIAAALIVPLLARAARLAPGAMTTA